jgi:hypothetical protein
MCPFNNALSLFLEIYMFCWFVNQTGFCLLMISWGATDHTPMSLVFKICCISKNKVRHEMSSRICTVSGSSCLQEASLAEPPRRTVLPHSTCSHATKTRTMFLQDFDWLLVV